MPHTGMYVSGKRLMVNCGSKPAFNTAAKNEILEMERRK